MSAPLLPPPERELPAPARDRIRAAAVARVDAARTPSRRWLPLAAAAAAVAVVGGSALAVAGRPPTPAGPVATATPGPTGRQLPPDAALAGRCARDSDSGAAGLRAAFADERGYLVWVAGAEWTALCAYRWDGTPDGDVARGPSRRIDPQVPATGYAPADGAHVTLDLTRKLVERSVPARAQLVFLGQVARDVARVELSWSGHGTARAAVRGPYYLGRVLAPPDRGGLPELRGSVTAYGPDGRPLSPLEFIE
jgi:hypothetical protein